MYLRGATIPKKEAKKVGITLLFGMIGIAAIGLTIGIKDKVTVFIISFVLAGIGYFGIANRVLKK